MTNLLRFYNHDFFSRDFSISNNADTLQVQYLIPQFRGYVEF